METLLRHMHFWPWYSGRKMEHCARNIHKCARAQRERESAERNKIAPEKAIAELIWMKS